MRNRNLFGVLLLALTCALLVGCAAGVNPAIASADAHGVVAGFWRGLWHGMISPVTLVISWFSDHVSIYEVHNNGGWYDFGFMVGLSCIGGGSHARRRRPSVSAIRVVEA